MKRSQLAQVNIGRARAPLDDESMQGFVSRPEEINALAEAWPGFVWRLTSDVGPSLLTALVAADGAGCRRLTARSDIFGTCPAT